MQAQIKLGRIFGVEIGLHYSWLIIAVLIATSLAGHFYEVLPNWGAATIWATAIATALLFFVAIILHELSHAAVAKMRGLPVRSITLFALGGVAEIGQEPSDAKTEFWTGIAGPLASILIGGICLVLAVVLGWSFASEPGTPVTAMLVWLGFINIGLAVFNMVPGFPLDGGRVLRAILWWFTGNASKSTRWAAAAGQFVAYAFIIIGVLRFFGGAGISGLWIAFIGWFLLTASQSTNAQVQVKELLKGVRVADVMTRDCVPLDGNTNLQTFVHEYLLRTGRRCFLILERDQIAGLITLNEVKAIPQARWPLTTVHDVMIPLEHLRTVSPDTPVSEALEIIGRENVHQLPVVSNGHLDGMITRDQIVSQLLTRAELKM